MAKTDVTQSTSPMRIGELLVSQGKLTERDLERALLAQGEMGGLLGQVLIKLGLVAETDIVAALCHQLDVSFVTKDAYPETPMTLPAPTMDFLISNEVIPVGDEEGRLIFAATRPQDPFLSKALSLATGRNIELRLGLQEDIEAALELYQGTEEGAEEGDFDQFSTSDEEFVEHLKDLASEAPVIQRVNSIIQKALDIQSSDIHLEFFDDGLRLRYRIDGVLQESVTISDDSLAAAIISRIKLLANLNIAERRLPQDGRIMTRVKGHELDLRVSTLPTVHGEGVVMRVLDRQSIKLDLSGMGFSSDTLEHYKSLLQRPHGVLLLTGPTGSGKTTTLYSSLSNLDAEALKIITVEDPVEYQLHGINQIPVHSQIGLTFAKALRSILRQDPDIIMIGEMRDTETAQIAVQSALTGHLVLSTLHTNTAAGAITRLEDMGIERFLITAAVNGVLAQRLLRRLCDDCKRPAEITGEALQKAGLEALLETDASVYEPVGCASCKNTGYRGRLAIHELFVLDASIQRAIHEGADALQLRELARTNGMRTLYEDGVAKVAHGVTSIEEVIRVTQDQAEDASVNASAA